MGGRERLPHAPGPAEHGQQSRLPRQQIRRAPAQQARGHVQVVLRGAAGERDAARVDAVVFGAADPKTGACGSLYNLCVDPRLNHEIEVTAGVRADEAAALLTHLFGERRP